MERLLTTEEVATILGIPRETIYNWRLAGKGPKAVKVGRHLRFRESAVESFVTSLEDDGGAAA